jgi:hypothetical protein
METADETNADKRLKNRWFPLILMHSEFHFAINHTTLNRKMNLNVTLSTILLLCGSNVFMTFAWYAHLKQTVDYCRVGELGYRIF